MFFKHVKPKVHSSLCLNRALWTNKRILFLVWGQRWIGSLILNNTLHMGRLWTGLLTKTCNYQWTGNKNKQHFHVRSRVWCQQLVLSSTSDTLFFFFNEKPTVRRDGSEIASLCWLVSPRLNQHRRCRHRCRLFACGCQRTTAKNSKYEHMYVQAVLLKVCARDYLRYIKASPRNH